MDLRALAVAFSWCCTFSCIPSSTSSSPMRLESSIPRPAKNRPFGRLGLVGPSSDHRKHHLVCAHTKGTQRVLDSEGRIACNGRLTTLGLRTEPSRGHPVDVAWLDSGLHAPMSARTVLVGRGASDLLQESRAGWVPNSHHHDDRTILSR